MDIVINTQSVRYSQKYSIRFLYSLVLSQFPNELIGFCRIALTKDRPLSRLDIAKAISTLSLLSKVIPVLIVNQCKNRTAYRNPGITFVSCFFQGIFIKPDLLGLLSICMLLADCTLR
jgi:hypothetical protein